MGVFWPDDTAGIFIYHLWSHDPSIPSLLCTYATAQPLLLKDNFFHTPLLLQRNGIETPIKCVTTWPAACQL